MLLVEDDPGDALLVEELLSETDLTVQLDRATSVAEALPLLQGADCVLLDLALPDSFGLEGLRALLAADPHVAVVVLTGLADRSRGAQAVASGAQDYLIKAEVDASLLGRSVRYAIERRRADVATRRLLEANLRRGSNERIQRGLLPRPLLRSDDLEVATVYRPGGGGDVLGGDFYDAVELEDGTLRAVIGDVCGHGPDEAALGVCLRIAWRTLVVASTLHDRVLPALDDVLVAERQRDETFVTVCDISVAPDRRTATVRLAGHPPPLLLGSTPTVWPGSASGPPLGVLPGPDVGGLGGDAARPLGRPRSTPTGSSKAARAAAPTGSGSRGSPPGSSPPASARRTPREQAGKPAWKPRWPGPRKRTAARWPTTSR